MSKSADPHGAGIISKVLHNFLLLGGFSAEQVKAVRCGVRSGGFYEEQDWCSEHVSGAQVCLKVAERYQMHRDKGVVWQVL